jgi:hypothetical protein
MLTQNSCARAGEYPIPKDLERSTKLFKRLQSGALLNSPLLEGLLHRSQLLESGFRLDFLLRVASGCR